MMRLFRPWSVFSCLYPEAVFRVKTGEKLLLLTFDDGPDPASTPVILDILREYNVKSIFFCTGSRAEKYPELIKQIKAAGHFMGNHGYSHLNGWNTPFKDYIDDIHRADRLTSSEFFRPPYGRLTFRQYRELKNEYRIFFWDIMPYDFDTSFSPGNALQILKKKIRPGSVIVLHDNPAAAAGKILEEFLAFAASAGYILIDPVDVVKL